MMKWNHIKPQIKHCKLNQIDILLLEMQNNISFIKSLKEIFLTIYLPIQIAIWAFGKVEIYNINVIPLIMIGFTILFVLLINKLNRVKRQIEVDLETLKKIEASE